MLVDKNNKPITKYRNLNIIDDDKCKIKLFLQGAVYCWCNIEQNKGKPFAARDLIGKNNWVWEGTPLQKLYDELLKQKNSNKEEAFIELGIKAGFLLKECLIEDNRKFKLEKKNIKGKETSTYQYI